MLNGTNELEPFAFSIPPFCVFSQIILRILSLARLLLAWPWLDAGGGARATYVKIESQNLEGSKSVRSYAPHELGV